jgi:hypothetical protein
MVALNQSGKSRIHTHVQGLQETVLGSHKRRRRSLYPFIIGLANVALGTHGMSHRAKSVTPLTIVELQTFLSRLVTILVVVRRSHDMGAANLRSSRLDTYIRMKHFVRRYTLFPFRRFCRDVRR